jgi:hypothetical protein
VVAPVREVLVSEVISIRQRVAVGTDLGDALILASTITDRAYVFAYVVSAAQWFDTIVVIHYLLEGAVT